MTILKAGRPSKSKKDIAISALQDTSEESIRMNVNIPKRLHKKIKLHALNEDVTVTNLVIKVMSEYISK